MSGRGQGTEHCCALVEGTENMFDKEIWHPLCLKVFGYRSPRNMDPEPRREVRSQDTDWRNLRMEVLKVIAQRRSHRSDFRNKR